MNAATIPLCAPAGYTLGFFNGVWNTYREATDGLLALNQVTTNTYNGLPISGEVFYNHTGCGTVGATCLQDVAEVFIQRATAVDPAGNYSNRLEFFWDLMSGSSTLTATISGIIGLVTSPLDAIAADLRGQMVAGMSYQLSHPPTAADYVTHNTRLDALKTEGQKLLLVAHSQGNLFVNQAYDHILQSVGAPGVSVVHIAPASPTLRGPHILAVIDLVINALRLVGTVPAVNSYILPSTSDLSGHTLVGTYLDPTRSARTDIQTLLMNALAGLGVPAITTTGGALGSFTVTLNWSGMGDEDMHVFEPLGAHVYYASKAGATGYLDVDNTVGLGPEHYYGSCDPTILQPGTYSIGINNFNMADFQTATVQVATANAGVLLTKQVNTGATVGPAGDAAPIPVASVTVTKDPITGNFSFAAQ